MRERLKAARRRIADLEAVVETDALTGVLNRRGFERELRRSIAYVQRYGATAAVLFADVDALKPINDRHGHAAGDVVLAAAAQALVAHVRVSDVVARLGGDEFGVILWNLTKTAARAKCRSLRGLMMKSPATVHGHQVPIALSFGMTMIAPGDEPDQVIERADQAMYAMKRGRASLKGAGKARLRR
jgi:diguanylate cyclase (GGDEF)-like protein